MFVINQIKRHIPASIKNIIKRFPIRITKNQRYDFYTQKLIKEHLHSNSNCIDVGCYKGEILDLFLKYCTNGHHYAFEPIQDKHSLLQEKYNKHKNVELHNVALSNKTGTETFHFVKSNPSYSGFKKRRYEQAEEIDIVNVHTMRLDDLHIAHKIDCIKIDVEGAESLVIEGAIETIQKNKPLVIFEHGLGGSELYGTTSELFDLLHMLGLQIYTFESFFKQKTPLTKSELQEQFDKSINHYFVAK